MELSSGEPQLQPQKYLYSRRNAFEKFVILNQEIPAENYSEITKL